LVLFLGWANALLAQVAPPPALPRVPPGLEYVHERIGEVPWSIHVVKVDRQRLQFRLTAALARDSVYGLASVSEQIGDVAGAHGRPVAAVNGDFFHIRPGPYQGDPLGLHISRGDLVSAPTGTSFWIDAEGEPHIGLVKARFRATGPDGFRIRFGLNEARAENAAVLYTPALGESTRTSGGLELVLAKRGAGAWLPLRAGRRYAATVSAVRRDGDTKLTPETMVLSIGPELAVTLPDPRPGAEIELHLETTPDMAGVLTAIGGGPVLLEDGTPRTWEPPLPRHPRTVLGWNDEQFFLVVVDGRQDGLSAGMTYPELAALMQRLGCTHAMNLDGGGSSTLWLGGRIMNSPSDGRERRVANSLIVISREPEETP
jgi:hypothetical protein